MMVTRTATSFEERVGLVLVEGGFLTRQQLTQAQDTSRASGTALLDTLVSSGVLAQETLVTVLSFQLRIPVVDLRHAQVDPAAVRLIPEEYARQNAVLPMGFDADGSLRIATKMPNDFKLSAELTAVAGRQTKFVLAIGGRLEELIDRTYAAGAVQRPASAAQVPATAATMALAPAGAAAPSGALGEDVSQLPAVQAVDLVTLQAVKARASDIHLVPDSDSARVLFRRDGVLQKMTILPLTLHQSMISRIKVQAGMDIAETRRPQDGTFSMAFGERGVDFRVSCIGTTWGEMMVIRILDRSQGLFSLEDLGLESVSLLVWRQLMALPYGMVLVSGPTGAGKTTTLFTPRWPS
jgi:type IV pilus assembly protein PilB